MLVLCTAESSQSTIYSAVPNMTDGGLPPLYNTVVGGSSQAACLSAGNRGRQGSLLKSCEYR